jgi:hypothetical protein
MMKLWIDKGQYELFHQRFGHPGERVMQNLHLHVNDVPNLKGNSFYKCLSCLHAKIQNRTTKLNSPALPAVTTIPSAPEQQQQLENGQEFSMDFGFM